MKATRTGMPTTTTTALSQSSQPPEGQSCMLMFLLKGASCSKGKSILLRGAYSARECFCSNVFELRAEQLEADGVFPIVKSARLSRGRRLARGSD